MKTLQNLKSQTLTYILALGLGVGILSGCKDVRTEYSEPKVFGGIVTNKRHVKEEYLNPIDNINPMKDIDPFYDMKKGRWATKRNEEFDVYIHTNVGDFIVNDRRLYSYTNEADSVQVVCREKFEVTYDKVDGQTKEVARALQGYTFENAFAGHAGHKARYRHR